MSTPTVLARAGAAIAFAATTAMLLLANPASADAPAAPPATTTAVAQVGLIPSACATIDPVRFPCPGGAR